jgi:hypothetical protein
MTANTEKRDKASANQSSPSRFGAGARRVREVTMAEQTQLFHETPGQVLTELCVDAVTRSDEELMALARPLLTLIRYWESKQS